MAILLFIRWIEVTTSCLSEMIVFGAYLVRNGTKDMDDVLQTNDA